MKKILKITGIVIVSILLLLVLTPLIFKGKIQEQVKKVANKALTGEVNYKDADLSFFSHFPNLTLTLTEFSLKGSKPFDQDTLLSADEVGFGVNLKSLFGKKIQITRVYLEKARVNILYNETGTPNYDVYSSGDTITDNDTTSGGAEINIEHISFTNSRLVYSDASIPVKLVAENFNYSGSSKMTSDIFDVTSSIEIGTIDLFYDNQPYITKKPVIAKMNTKINSRDLTIFFEKNDLKIKDIPFQFNGKFNFEKDGYALNLTFLSVMEKEFFSARFKLVQGSRLWISAKANASVDLEKWSKAFELKVAVLKGTYELNMTAEGSYETGPVKRGIRNETDTVITSIPKFELMTKLSNGYFKYSSLPQALSNINFSLNASCPDNNYRNINVQLENLQATLMKNQIKGYFRMNSLEDVPIDANLTAQCNLAELSQAIPMDSLGLSGMLDINLNVKGNYAPQKKLFPVTTALISLKNGKIQTKYYPNPIENIEILTEVTNRTGAMSDMVVTIKPLNFSFEGKPFTLTASLQNFADMRYHLQSDGVIDLGKVYKVFSRKGMALDGYIETHLSLQGKQSDAMAGRYEKLNNSGTLKIRDIELRSEDYPKPFIIKTGNFRFDQDKIWFNDFLAIYGASDFRLKGSVLNTISYLLSQGKSLKGDFQLNSDLINVNEFMVFAPADNSKGKNTGASGVVIIPPDLDIDFKASVKRTSFEGLDIRDLHGEIDLKEGILVLSKAGFNLIGCNVGMDATYGSITPEKAHFDFHVKAEDFDIKRAYNEIALVREMASSAEKAEGIVSLEYDLKGRLNGEMYPVLPSLEGGGTVSLKKIKVSGLKLFNDIGKNIEKEGIKNPDLTKVDIKSTVKNNIITLEQFKFKVKGIRLKISGTTSLDSKLNLRIRVGLGPFGIIGIPMKITGTMEDLKFKYGKGKESDEIPDSEYKDELPAEMLQRIKNAKDDSGDEEEPGK